MEDRVHQGQERLLCRAPCSVAAAQLCSKLQGTDTEGCVPVTLMQGHGDWNFMSPSSPKALAVFSPTSHRPILLESGSNGQLTWEHRGFYSWLEH